MFMKKHETLLTEQDQENQLMSEDDERMDLVAEGWAKSRVYFMFMKSYHFFLKTMFWLKVCQIVMDLVAEGWSICNYLPDNCERRELPSQSYGRPKKRNKILNIVRRTIL